MLAAAKTAIAAPRFPGKRRLKPASASRVMFPPGRCPARKGAVLAGDRHSGMVKCSSIRSRHAAPPRQQAWHSDTCLWPTSGAGSLAICSTQECSRMWPTGDSVLPRVAAFAASRLDSPHIISMNVRRVIGVEW